MQVLYVIYIYIYFGNIEKILNIAFPLHVYFNTFFL